MTPPATKDESVSMSSQRFSKVRQLLVAHTRQLDEFLSELETMEGINLSSGVYAGIRTETYHVRSLITQALRNLNESPPTSRT